jgi:hypothetical protein
VATSALLLAAIAVNAAVCVAGLCVWFALKSHLRTNHPLVWNRFQFPRDGIDDERAETTAQFGLWEYIRSNEWRSLSDSRLERLAILSRYSFYAGCLTMLACTVVFSKGW